MYQDGYKNIVNVDVSQSAEDTKLLVLNISTVFKRINREDAQKISR